MMLVLHLPSHCKSAKTDGNNNSKNNLQVPLPLILSFIGFSVSASSYLYLTHKKSMAQHARHQQQPSQSIYQIPAAEDSRHPKFTVIQDIIDDDDLPSPKEAYLETLLKSVKLPKGMMETLEKSKQYDIRILLDNSGSMSIKDNILERHDEENNIMASSKDPWLQKTYISRWEEAEYRLLYIMLFMIPMVEKNITIQTFTDIAYTFDCKAILHELHNKEFEEIVRYVQKTLHENIFKHPPNCPHTPLFTKLDSMTDKIMINENNEKPNLFLVLTDGEPQGKTEPKFMPISAKGPSIKNRFHHLRAKLNGPKNSPMVFSLCGDSHSGRDFLNWVDENIEQTATLDDFPTESQQVFSAQGNSFKYDFIDYSLNHILAALDENFDNLDEKNSPLLTQSFLENNIYGRCLEDSEYMNYRHEANKARKNEQPTQLKRVNFPLPGLRTVLKYNAKNTQKLTRINK